MSPPVQAFLDRGADFVVDRTLDGVVRGINELTGTEALDVEVVRRELLDHDLQGGLLHSKDLQLATIRGARAYLSERLIRIAKPAPILDLASGPLIAVRLRVLPRKTLGGLETDLQSCVLGEDGIAGWEAARATGGGATAALLRGCRAKGAGR